MQRSPSLTRAISTAEILLRADTDDLRKLAEIAGEDPAEMYLAADLTGVDLRSQDISFLVGLSTNFEGARLTDEQKRQLRSGKKRERKLNVRRQLRDLRIQLIRKFIERQMYSAVGSLAEISCDNDEYLQRYATPFEAMLCDTLLDPVLQSSSAHSPDSFGSDYMKAALLQFRELNYDGSTSFFLDLFQLFGDIYAPVDGAVIEILKRHYRDDSKPHLNDLLGRMRPSKVLDTWWILDQTGFQAMIGAAAELSQHRKVHAEAVESFTTEVSDINISLKMLTDTQYDLEVDRAERIAYALISRKWPARMVPDVLNARVPRQLQAAFFRQLLAQADGERVIEVVRWLDQDRGAVGALSLENAIQHLNDFSDLYKLGMVLRPNIRASQIEVLKSRLLQLARSKTELAQVKQLG